MTTKLTLEDLGMTKEQVLDRVVERIVDGLLDEDSTPGEREAVRYAIEGFADATLTPNVARTSWRKHIERWTSSVAASPEGERT